MSNNNFIPMRIVTNETGPQLADVYGRLPAAGHLPGSHYATIKGALMGIKEGIAVTGQRLAPYVIYDRASGAIYPVYVSVAELKLEIPK